MPTKKQRRRREKLQRHEYEEVYVDAEGREIPLDDVEVEQARTPSPRAKRDEPRRGAARAIQPPSWRRVGRRTLIFGPLMFVTVMLLEPDAGLFAQATLTMWMVLLFAPFTYVMDMLTYRMLRRREARTAVGRGR